MHGAGILLGPFIGGTIFDVTGSCQYAFLLAGLSILFATCVVIFGLILTGQRKKLIFWVLCYLFDAHLNRHKMSRSSRKNVELRMQTVKSKCSQWASKSSPIHYELIILLLSCACSFYFYYLSFFPFSQWIGEWCESEASPKDFVQGKIGHRLRSTELKDIVPM